MRMNKTKSALFLQNKGTKKQKTNQRNSGTKNIKKHKIKNIKKTKIKIEHKKRNIYFI